MLRINGRDLDGEVSEVLSDMQRYVGSFQAYESQISEAKKLWGQRRSVRVYREAFSVIKSTLASMNGRLVRCAYCEDSMADEIEHIYPKDFFPELCFSWENYLLACGPCNGPKGNRFATIANESDSYQEFLRPQNSPIIRPPADPSAFINPREEDPLHFMELDLGGVVGNQTLTATYTIIPRVDVSARDMARADFTIDVLGLNREVIRFARENAYAGFKARIREYVDLRTSFGDLGSWSDDMRESLSKIKNDVLSTSHLTVFVEMQRQFEVLPDIYNLFVEAPEILDW